MKNKLGISLVVVVITIVIMVILAGAVILTISDKGLISNTKNTVVKNDLLEIISQLDIKLKDKDIRKNINNKRYTLKELNIESGNYEEYLFVEKGKLRIYSNSPENIVSISEDLGIKKTNNASTRSGTVQLNNTNGATLMDYKIYGNTAQSGKPTPAAPVQIESLGTLVADTTDLNYGKYKIPVLARGKNMFDRERFINDAIALGGGNVLSIDNNSNGIRIKNITYLERYNKTDFGFEANQVYTFSCDVNWESYGDERTYVALYIYYTDGTYTRNPILITNTNINVTTTSNKTISHILFSEWQYVSAASTVVLSNIQLEKGNQKTAYESYKGVKTDIYLDEPLRKVGNYADYIDLEKGKVVRKVKEEKITSFNASVGSHPLNFGVYRLIYDIVPAPDEGGFCNKIYYRRSHDNGDLHFFIETQDNNAIFFVYPKDEFTTFAAASTWLNSVGDIKVCFAMHERYWLEKSIDLPQIKTINGTTNLVIYSNNGIKASNIEVEY